VTSVSFRLAFAFVAMVLLQERGCGFTPVEKKGEGEPCTRTTECEDGLDCRGGVCMPSIFDGSIRDASAPADASSNDASSPTDASSSPEDASSDGAIDAAQDSGS
jgi:hypothetical protein